MNQKFIIEGKIGEAIKSGERKIVLAKSQGLILVHDSELTVLNSNVELCDGLINELNVVDNKMDALLADCTKISEKLDLLKFQLDIAQTKAGIIQMRGSFLNET